MRNLKVAEIMPEITAEKIESAEAELLKLPQIKSPVFHEFGPEIYIRKLKSPAGTILIGHSHNYAHMNILLEGRVTLLNDDGTTSEIKAPFQYVAKPGRKVAFVHEDMTWLNIYSNPDNNQDVEALEKKFMTKSETFKLSQKEMDVLLLGTKSIDQRDYFQSLIDLGLTHEEVLKTSRNDNDITDLPFGSYKFKFDNSPIDGKGVFAAAEIYKGEIVGPGRIGDKRTILGRFTNHAKNPNAKFIRSKDGNIDLVAIRKIYGCRGGFNGDEITVDYRDAVKLTREIQAEALCQV